MNPIAAVVNGFGPHIDMRPAPMEPEAKKQNQVVKTVNESVATRKEATWEKKSTLAMEV